MDKETQSQLRQRFKQAVHQKHPKSAFRLAIIASDTLRSGGLEPSQALHEASRWLCVHGKGPSLSEWKELAQIHRTLVASAQPSREGQMQLFQYTYILVTGLTNWKRHLRRLPQLIDVILGSTIPILSQTTEVPVSMRLMLLEKVEEVLSSHNKTPSGRCSLAELRMTRGRLLLALEDTSSQSEGIELLQQQTKVFARLAKQGTAHSARLLKETQELLSCEA